MIRLLGSTKHKIIEIENDEDVPHLDNTEVVLVHCNIVKNDYLSVWFKSFEYICS